jgi:hypothetical protein
MGTAAGSSLSGIGGLGQYNLYGQNLGQAQGITQNLVNNPYAAQYQQGAGTASGLGQQAALGSYGAGAGLYGAGGQILNTAFDPQQQLYNQQLALTQSQQNAANAQAGVGTTPYGAGLQDQNLQNFNIAWQNAQLGRQAQGLQAAGAAYGQGSQMQNAAPGQYLQASAIPYGTYGAIGQGQLGALSGLGQFGQNASTLPQQQITDYDAYLGIGNQANSVANQTAGLQNAIQQQNLGNIFGGLGNLGSFYGAAGYPSVFGGGSSQIGNQLNAYTASSPAVANPYSGAYSYQGLFGSS